MTVGVEGHASRRRLPNPSTHFPAMPTSDLKTRARKVNARLEKRYPNAKCSLDFTNPFELLMATILSAQSTDVRVNIVTKSLFRKVPEPARLRRGLAGGDGEGRSADRVLPEQGQSGHRLRAGHRRAARRRSPAHDGGADRASRRGAQDRERRPRQCLRHTRRNRRRHARDSRLPAGWD